MDRGFPRYLDSLFPGVPIDADLVFQYKGKEGRRGYSLGGGSRQPPSWVLCRGSPLCKGGAPASSGGCRRQMTTGGQH